MNKKKLGFLLVIMVLLLLFTTGVAAANGVINPYPNCGMHTVSVINDIFPAHSDENIQLGNELVGGVNYLAIVSSHGWEIVGVDILLGDWTIDEFTFPHVTKALVPPPGVAVLDIFIILEKECPTCNNIPTGRFVYTLFGNYPCNLISEDKPIPARFLILSTPDHYVISRIWNTIGMGNGFEIQRSTAAAILLAAIISTPGWMYYPNSRLTDRHPNPRLASCGRGFIFNLSRM